MVHSNNEQIIVKDRDGVAFEVAITHIERGGKHHVVVTTEPENLSRLRASAKPMSEMIAQREGIAPEKIAYYERGRDGAAFQVDLSQKEPASRTPGAGREKRSGRWMDEADVEKRLGSGELPEVKQNPTLKEIIKGLAREAKQAANEALGQVERPRHQKPRL